ncbi:nuclear transport factor 2 family protein [Halotia wernerae UHCC 0503]|nr:nuclear transport factor 2 family protein [Halotia wernerae UHCC 0503]
MSEQENVQIVRQVCAAFEQGNIAYLLGALAEDVEWYVVGSQEHLPLAGKYHGRDRVAEIFSMVGQYLELHQFQAQEFIAQDNQVAVFGQARGLVKLTSRSLEYDWVHVYTLCDRQIIKFREYLDTAAIAVAFSSPETTSTGSEEPQPAYN